MAKASQVCDDLRLMANDLQPMVQRSVQLLCAFNLRLSRGSLYTLGDCTIDLLCSLYSQVSRDESPHISYAEKVLPDHKPV